MYIYLYIYTYIPGKAWRAAIHGVAKSQTRLSDWTELNMILEINYISIKKFILLFPKICSEHFWERTPQKQGGRDAAVPSPNSVHFSFWPHKQSFLTSPAVPWGCDTELWPVTCGQMWRVPSLGLVPKPPPCSLFSHCWLDTEKNSDNLGDSRATAWQEPGPGLLISSDCDISKKWNGSVLRHRRLECMW